MTVSETAPSELHDGSLLVGFDDQIFRLQRRGGISKCVVELAAAMQRAGVSVSIPGPWTTNGHLLDTGRWRRPPGAEPLARRVAKALNRSPRELDVLHHTFYDPAALKCRTKFRLRVSTLYDMIPETHPELVPPDAHMSKREFLRQSDKVVCISETVRQEVQAFGWETGALHVAPLGVSSRSFRVGDRPKGLPRPYVLHVGGRAGYKSFEDILPALAGQRELDLVVVGGGGFSARERQSLVTQGIDRRVHWRDARDDEMPELYGHAMAFMTASRAEGFGLPGIEALAAGCPVIATDIAVHREVLGNQASFVAAGDVDGFAHALATLSDDQRQRDSRRAHASRFTWDASAATLLQVYRGLR